MMAVAVELMMMKVALEGCPVLEQPDLATNRVALARLLEEHIEYVEQPQSRGIA
jgi:hypothetical protein